MNVIAAVDKNWAIGKENKLLVSIPADMKFFREMTTGKAVVMGRKTANPAYQVKDAIVVHSKDELNEELRRYHSDDIYVIGGESVYRMMLEECDTAYITKIDYSYEADSYFPNLDEKDNWRLEAESEEQTYFDLEYCFLKYKRV